MKKYFIFIALLVLIFSIGSVCAEENGDNSTLEVYDVPIEVDATDLDDIISSNEIVESNDDSSHFLNSEEDYKLEDSSEVIIVNNWDELQLYAGKTDKNYVVKLKENTNFYPTDVSDINYQIQIKNNLTIIGSKGSYIGDKTPNAAKIEYIAMITADNSNIGVHMENITFKWISLGCSPDGIFLKMAGNTFNSLKNCYFTKINMYTGHSCIVYIKLGDATLDNCSFIDCTTDFGTVSIYDPNSVTSCRMLVEDCYFKGNYARTEPGCINNCGILVVKNSTFIENSAFWWAGAIHTHTGANATIYDSYFQENDAGWNGGALFSYSYLSIYNTTFKKNKCHTDTGGGAIGAYNYGSTPHVYIEDSIFEGNENLCWAADSLSSGTGAGGAISVVGGTLDVYNSTFIKNSAANGPAISSGATTLVGNSFIDHTRQGEITLISPVEVHDNYYYGNSIGFYSTLTFVDFIDEKVIVDLDISLIMANYYDKDILEKTCYYVYVNGALQKIVNSTRFSIDVEDRDKINVYVIPSFSIYKSQELKMDVPREYIYVSKQIGSDSNDGLTAETPVYSLSKAIELARTKSYIKLLDGNFDEQDLVVDYDLTIIGSQYSSISNMQVSNNIFEVNNAKLSIKDLMINNISSKNEFSRLIKENSGKIIFNRCTFDSNSFATLLDTESLNIKNSIFKNNEISIISNNLILNNVDFINNVATNALINSKNCTIIGSTFMNNTKSNNGLKKVSCIILNDLGILDITSSKFISNDKELAIIYKENSNSILNILNSVLINNSNSYVGGLIDGNVDNVICDYNWWGNTFENINDLPNLNSKITLNNWLFLNSSSVKYLEHGINTTINLTLNNLITKSGDISTYKYYDLPTITFKINAYNATSDSNNQLTAGKSEILISLNSTNNALILIDYETIELTVNFEFIKSNPNIITKVKNIKIGDDENIRINLPNDATGTIEIQIGNYTESKIINNSNVIFDIKNLIDGLYEVSVKYSGDIKYNPFEDKLNFTVNKHDSTINISVGKITVSEDVILTISVPNDASGNVSVIVNENEEIFTISNPTFTYTISNITSGDWIIKTVYHGDSKYLASESNLKFEVGKSNSSVIIFTDDIYYNEDANIQIILERDATGNITVFVDGKNKTAELYNGKAIVVFSNLTAGYKKAQIQYSGDRHYYSGIYPIELYVEKIPIQFNISSNNAKEGQNIIGLTIDAGVTGNFTINVGNISEIINIPMSGKIKFPIYDLTAGEYNVTVVYNGENYLTCSNSVKITVYPWNAPQWPSEGFDGSGKSPYEINNNGEVLWVVENNKEISGNVIIDSEGNIYIIVSNGILSFDKNGNSRWNYTFIYGNTFSGMSVGREVIISPVSGDTLYFINQTSSERIGSIYQGSSCYSPVIDKKYNIYISGEKDYGTGNYNLIVIPYRLWVTGGDFISINLGSVPTTSPVIVNDNIVCVGTEKGLKLIDISQEKVISNLNIITNVRPVVGDGGIIYALTSDELIAIDSAGNQLWKSNTSGEAKYLAIDNENGLLYSIDKQGNLYKYDILDNGAKTLISNLNVTSGILIGNDGTLYLGADTTFIALDSNGEFLWKSNIGETITGTPVMDADGNIYVTGNTTLFALTNAPLKDINLKINTSNVKYGEDIKINMTFNKDATGEIIVKINNNTYVIDTSEGKAEISISNLTSGNYNVDVTYKGDKRYSACEMIEPVNVTKVELPASVIVIPGEIKTNDPSFSINLPTDATGSLTVIVNGKSYSSDLADGKATVNIPKLSSGKHNIVVTYSGDENYVSVTNSKTVTVPSPKITENKDVVMDYNDGSAYKVRVLGIDGKAIAGELVTFNINGKESKIKTDNNGYASIKITEIPKTYKITATYNGISVKNTVTVKQILKSGNYKVKKSAKKLVLKATLKSSNGKPIKGKTITFKLNGKTYKAKTNKNGIAKVTIKKNVIKKLKVKKYTLKITYLKTTIKKTVTVKK